MVVLLCPHNAGIIRFEIWGNQAIDWVQGVHGAFLMFSEQYSVVYSCSLSILSTEVWVVTVVKSQFPHVLTRKMPYIWEHNRCKWIGLLFGIRAYIIGSFKKHNVHVPIPSPWRPHYCWWLATLSCTITSRVQEWKIIKPDHWRWLQGYGDQTS